MIYLFYTKWPITKDNHAGFGYLSKKLAELYPSEFYAIELPQRHPIKIPESLAERIRNQFFLRLNYRYLTKYVRLFKKVYKPDRGDTIISTEYLVKGVHSHYPLINAFRKSQINYKIAAFVHYTPEELRSFSSKELKKWISKLDRTFTLGSTLTKYLSDRGGDLEIRTTFHYVDDYYFNTDIGKCEYSVLVQGTHQRDNETLLKIVKGCPDVKFNICTAGHDLSRYFNFPNVRLYGYLRESELRDLMFSNSVSLNVMKDTIGSNAIVCSMAAGQAMIVTDVGSIRDYCSEKNAFFCKAIKDYIDAIHLLKNDCNLLQNKRRLSNTMADAFKIEYFKLDLLRQLK